MFTTTPAGPTANGQFQNPNGIDVDPSGEYVFVSETGNNRVQQFDANGNFIQKWGGSGSGAGQFNEPFAVAAGPPANEWSFPVYVADTENHRVQKFSVIDDDCKRAVREVEKAEKKVKKAKGKVKKAKKKLKKAKKKLKKAKKKKRTAC